MGELFMRNYNHTIIGAVFTLLIVALLSSCTMEKLCEGSMVLTNTIADVTVAVGDTLFIDLANPPVFVSSKGEVTYSPWIRQGFTNINVNRIPNSEDGGDLSILVIIGRSVGEAVIELEVFSGCLENSLSFNINIIE